jgi:hypothetical protein
MSALFRAAAVAALITAGAPWAAAQTSTDPHHPETLTQAEQPAGAEATQEQLQSTQPVAPAQPGSAAPGSMGPGMMGQGMMGQGMMGQGMMGQGMMGAGMGQMRMTAHGHAMKIMFAIADGDANGALSFEEVSALHRRIFDAVDADDSGEVTREEIQSFMRD